MKKLLSLTLLLVICNSENLLFASKQDEYEKGNHRKIIHEQNDAGTEALFQEKPSLITTKQNIGSFSMLPDDLPGYILRLVAVQSRSNLALTCHYMNCLVQGFHKDHPVILYKDLQINVNDEALLVGSPNWLSIFYCSDDQNEMYDSTNIIRIEGRSLNQHEYQDGDDYKSWTISQCDQDIILQDLLLNKGFRLLTFEDSGIETKIILPHIDNDPHSMGIIHANKNKVFIHHYSQNRVSIHGLADTEGVGRSLNVLLSSPQIIPLEDKFIGCGEMLKQKLWLFNTEADQPIEKEFPLPQGMDISYGHRPDNILITADEDCIVFACQASSHDDPFALKRGPSFCFSIANCTSDPHCVATQFDSLPADFEPVSFHLKKNFLFILGAHKNSINSTYLDKDNGVFVIYDMKEKRPLLRHFLNKRPFSMDFAGNHLFYLAKNLVDDQMTVEAFDLKYWL